MWDHRTQSVEREKTPKAGKTNRKQTSAKMWRLILVYNNKIPDNYSIFVLIFSYFGQNNNRKHTFRIETRERIIDWKRYLIRAFELFNSPRERDWERVRGERVSRTCFFGIVQKRFILMTTGYGHNNYSVRK